MLSRRWPILVATAASAFALAALVPPSTQVAGAQVDPGIFRLDHLYMFNAVAPGFLMVLSFIFPQAGKSIQNFTIGPIADGMHSHVKAGSGCSSALLKNSLRIH